MVAQRRTAEPDVAPAIVSAPETAPQPASSGEANAVRPALAHGGEERVASPAHALQARVAAEYHEPQVRRWTPAVRAMIVLGSATGLWTMLAGAFLLLTR